MKKYLILVIAALLIVTSAAYAQDSSAQAIELGNTLVVNNPDFTFAYPSDWVHDLGQRISIAENKADLAAMTDDDDSTQPAGLSITLSSIPKAAVVKALSMDNPVLDDVLKLVGQSLTLDSTFDIPVMTRRAITFSGVNANGRYGIGSLWQMGDLYFALGLGTPDSSISDATQALYGAVVDSMRQFGDNPIKFPAEPELLKLPGLSIPYPDGWTPAEVTGGELDGTGFFQNPDDVKLFIEKGKTTEVGIVVLEASAKNIPATSAREIADLLSQDMKELTIEGEFLINGVLGYGFSGVNNDGYVFAIAMTPTDDRVVLYAISAVDQKTGEAAVPTFITMLQKIEAVE
ncbi:MAG: hypothetical protein R3E39_23510 [Anaerolineae bacterium]